MAAGLEPLAGVLLRLRHHVAPRGFHLDEQIDRNSGVSMAAKDLTWSYATTLKAMHKRGKYMALKTEMARKSSLRGGVPVADEE